MEKACWFGFQGNIHGRRGKSRRKDEMRPREELQSWEGRRPFRGIPDGEADPGSRTSVVLFPSPTRGERVPAPFSSSTL